MRDKGEGGQNGHILRDVIIGWPQSEVKKQLSIRKVALQALKFFAYIGQRRKRSNEEGERESLREARAGENFCRSESPAKLR